MREEESIMRLKIFVNGIVQMIMTVGIVFSAVHFERISVLWFLFIPAIFLNTAFTEKKGK